MFEALAIIPAVETVAVVGTVISDEVLDALIDNLADIPASRTLVMRHNQTGRDVAALIGAIEAYGVSPALLAFANYNGKLGAAIPSIPAVEALTTELSTEQAEKILTDLKAIKLDAREPAGDATEATAVNNVTAVIAGGIALFYGAPLWLAIVAMSAAVNLVAGYRRWADDEEGRLAKVVPFKFLSDHLEGIVKLSEISKELATVTLPKTKEEYDAFTKKVDGISAPLSLLGIHVSGDDVKVDTIPKPVKAGIESLGYHETALAEIVSLAKQAKVSIEGVKSLGYKDLITQLRATSMKGDERRFAGEGYDLIHDIVRTATARAAKICVLTKSTVGAIEHFYKLG